MKLTVLIPVGIPAEKDAEQLVQKLDIFREGEVIDVDAKLAESLIARGVAEKA